MALRLWPLPLRSARRSCWPGVTGAIVGARTPEQVDGWIGAAAIALTPEDVDEVATAIERTGAGAGATGPETPEWVNEEVAR